ncbi:YesL family protein [Aquibacillus albus]|uniref:Membrane protein YesL n=1 Tax=Aquibacillus albus TaxID=1168171 RepID=A0ABS2MWP9_9BACI|nr:DUF624 domain-containing protein [Aquibacillus albus]MBM7570213.1 putative membrane protein YesL [Aquibacillus albus]
MMQFNGLMKGIYWITDWITKLTITNLLWIVFNIPIVFMVLNLLVAETVGQLIAVGITIVALSPFVFFPATTAMFAVVRRWVMGDKEISIVKSYWKYYKENYKRSILMGLILGILWFIYAIDYYYFTVHVNQSLTIVLVIFALLLSVFTVHTISNSVHYDTKLSASFKNAVLITIGSPLLSILISLFNGALVYVSFTHATFLIPFFMGSVIAFISFSAYYTMYLKVEALKQQQQA